MKRKVLWAHTRVLSKTLVEGVVITVGSWDVVVGVVPWLEDAASEVVEGFWGGKDEGVPGGGVVLGSAGMSDVDGGGDDDSGGVLDGGWDEGGGDDGGGVDDGGRDVRGGGIIEVDGIGTEEEEGRSVEDARDGEMDGEEKDTELSTEDDMGSDWTVDEEGADIGGEKRGKKP